MSDRNADLYEWVTGKSKAFSFAATAKQALHQFIDDFVVHSHIPENIALGIGITGHSLGHVFLLGGVGAISVVTNQMEYQDGRDQIREFYHEELAAKNHKDLKKVKDSDLSVIEKTNGVIDTAVARERSFRNLGIAASFTASVIVVALMYTAFPHGIGGAALVGNLFSGSATATAIFDFASKAALGGLAYLATKEPIMRIGKALFGLNQETTHDMIVDIARQREQGKTISREQVIEVFISGNKRLAEYVEQSFGREYNDLALSDKVKVVTELTSVLPIDKIVQSINLGVTNASELAFTVQGDMSGVLPKPAQRERKKEESTLAKVANKCKGFVKSITCMFTAEKANPITDIAAINRTQQEPRERAERGEESPIVEMNQAPNFVQRLGRDPRAGEQHAAFVEQRRAEQVMMPASPTVQ